MPTGNFPSLPSLADNGGTEKNAFHGTSLDFAQAIIAGGFRTSRSGQHFLGDGVYFFEDQYEEAIAWANGRLPPPAVVRASVRFGKCLNLFKREYYEAYTKMERFLKSQGRVVSSATVINALAARMGAESVRAIYPKNPSKSAGKITYPFVTELRMIVCVRRLMNISNLEIVYPTVV